MSFLLDPPALVLLGFLIARYVQSRGRQVRLAAATVLAFLLVSGLLYLDLVPWWWGGPVAGPDFMLNSGLGYGLERSPGIDVLAVIMFAAYPLWAGLGLELGRRLDRVA